LQRQEAIRRYEASLNTPDTLFAINELLPARLDQLRTRLPDPITGDQATALNDVLYRRQPWTDLIAWLQDERLAWQNHKAREAFRADEDDRSLRERLI
jgi:hypothetical protein